MSISLLKKIFTLIFQTKFEFTKPSKKKILFFDTTHCTIVIKRFHLKEKDFNILHTRLEKLNFPLLIEAIIKNSFRLNLIDYYLEYLNATKPQKVFTFIDNNLVFYKLKKIS